MGLDCGASCAKIILFVFNAVFWIAGVILLCIGIILLVNQDFLKISDYVGDDKFSTWAFGCAFVVLGSISMIVGFFGCCGAIRESPCLLGTYILCLVVLLIILIVIAIVAGIYQNKVVEGLDDAYINWLYRYKYPTPPRTDDEKNDESDFIDWLQSSKKCCGFTSKADWGSKGPPPSCCNNVEDFRSFIPADYEECKSNSQQKVHAIGCKDDFESLCRRGFVIAIVVCACIAFVELVGILLATLLCVSIKSEKA